jgi:hypothetical protein
MSFDRLDQWALALVVGLLATRLLRITTRSLFAAPLLQRENYRGATLPTAAGLLIVLAVLFDQVQGRMVARGEQSQRQATRPGGPEPAPAET